MSAPLGQEPELSANTQPQRTEYMKLLELHNTNRIDYNVRKWETLKYFQSIVLAFIGGAIVAFTTGLDHGLFCKSFIASTAFTGAISTLPLIVCASSVLAVSNLRRETALLFAEEAECFKLAKLLELDIEVPKAERWIPGDSRLLMPKWRNWSHGISHPDTTMNFEQWVLSRSRGHRFKSISSFLFWFEMALALTILACVVIVYLSSNFPRFSLGSVC
jgi:hypothetical protein